MRQIIQFPFKFQIVTCNLTDKTYYTMYVYQISLFKACKSEICSYFTDKVTLVC